MYGLPEQCLAPLVSEEAAVLRQAGNEDRLADWPRSREPDEPRDRGGMILEAGDVAAVGDGDVDEAKQTPTSRS